MNPLLAQRSGAKRGSVIRTTTVPAPIGGLNARDTLASMKPTDAVVMDNWCPGLANVSVRPGFRTWASGITGNVETLLPYRSPAGNKMFAAAAGKIYDATSNGAVGSAVVTGLTNSRFQYVQFGTPGGQFLLAVNGADQMRLYNGTAWGTPGDGTFPSITFSSGITTAAIIGINTFGQRVWLVEKNSFRVWYLPLQSIGGTATALDLSSLFRLGGSLAGMITWTVAGSQNTTQYAVFVSTEGEVVLFQGYDPASAATWALAGQARIGRPVGSRFWTRVGTDVVLIGADGFVPLSEVLQLDRKVNTGAISNKIGNAAGQAVATLGGNWGWQVILYPSGNKLIVNVPTSEDSQSMQFVMNTATGAWCRYLGLNAFCWETTQDSIYYGGLNGVFQAEYGNTDDGAVIQAAMQPAFNFFGDGAINKRFTQVRPILESGGVSAIGGLTLVTNFDSVSSARSTPALRASAAALWDSSSWDQSLWAADTQMSYGWQWVGGMGFAATVQLRTTTTIAIAMDAISYAYEVGTGLY